ncbi:MAG: NifU N-terminal domain-containing protein [Candidatus Harrisonbacteria bacterium]|nr:NifU N-terminal domain-containing protein [Candidatus Harrisonbacteria bacterium]
MSEQNDLELKVVTQKSDNPESKEFHTRQRLTYYPEWYNGLADAYEFNVEDERNHRYDLAKNLLEIDGVQTVGIDGYIVTVTVSMAFDWKEVEELVLQVLKQYLQALINAKNLLKNVDRGDADKGKS